MSAAAFLRSNRDCCPKSGNLSVVIRHVPGAALRGLMAFGIAAGGPKNAAKEHDDDYGYDDEWGSDVHSGPVLHYPDYQRTTGRSWL